MLRCLLILFLISATTLTLHAQAPINTWPTTLKPGTHLALALHADSLHLVPCHLKSIDAEHLACSGRRHTTTTYNRSEIDMIQRARISYPVGFLFKAGLFSLFGQVLIIWDGPGLLTPIIIGLTAIAASAVLLVVEVTLNQRSPYLYVDPLLPTPSTSEPHI